MQLAIIPPVWNTAARTLELVDRQWTPDVGLDMEWRLLNEAGEICSTRKRISFDGDDYQNWGSGPDSAVILAVAAKLGLEAAPAE